MNLLSIKNKKKSYYLTQYIPLRITYHINYEVRIQSLVYDKTDLKNSTKSYFSWFLCSSKRSGDGNKFCIEPMFKFSKQN